MGKRSIIWLVCWLWGSSLLLLLVSTGRLQAQDDAYCFDETGFCIAGTVRAYWEEHGGLTVFGMPISPQYEEIIEGTPYQVQWFERTRLEVHPENEPPYHVLLGRLGAEQVEAAIQNGTWSPPPQEEPMENGCVYFAQTGWNVCDDILQAFRANGLETDGEPGLSLSDNVALFGLPLTPLIEMEIEGATYQVQWFERARFELHPENESPYHVLTGLLGSEALTDQSSPTSTEPPQQPATPTPTEMANEEPSADFAEHMRQGDTYFEQGAYTQALEAYNAAIALDPEQPEAYNSRGSTSMHLGQYEQAIADYSQAIALDATYVDAYYNRGLAYSETGAYDQAIADYSQAITLAPNDPLFFNARGIAYDAKGAYQRAIDDYTQALTLDPAYAFAYYNRALAYDSQGAYDRAIEDYTQFLAIEPEDSLAYYNRALAYHQKGAYEQAIEDYTQAIVLEAGEPVFYLDRGNAYFDKQAYEQALEDYSQAIALDASYAEAYYNRGLVYSEQEAYDRALEEYTQAIALQPSEATYYNERGSTYLLRGQTGDEERAIADATQAIALNPNIASFYNTRGYAYYLKGAKEQAIADYQRVLELSQNEELRAEAQARLAELGG